MIPAEDAELPRGSDSAIVRMVRFRAAATPRQGGVVSLIEADEEERLHVIGNRPWAGSPMFVILEYFGLPFSSSAYHRVLHSVREEATGNLFIRAEEDHPAGDPIKATLVQTVSGWGMEEAEAFLSAYRH